MVYAAFAAARGLQASECTMHHAMGINVKNIHNGPCHGGLHEAEERSAEKAIAMLLSVMVPHNRYVSNVSSLRPSNP
jgi:hypothetical protein